MKQIIVGIGVLATLVLYGIWVRHEQPEIAARNLASKIAQTNAASQPPVQPPAGNNNRYRDGTYTGSVEDAFYGNVQVSATIASGKLTGVSFLDFPHDHADSVMINQAATPLLKQEAVQSQSAQVDIISGATFTSEAFQKSLATALQKAQA